MDDKRKYRLTDHAREEAERRSIPLDVLDSVMNTPDQIVVAHSGRKVYQSRMEIDSKLYLIRVIVEEADPLVVITVYRTSNIKKYWSDES
ncbi:MAG: DUF4258 domain-containing protein [Anaerolineaceae bacterium]|nr:MAG: DUF4258 domain-containing protein [Anaerolineaceae bacterium]